MAPTALPVLKVTVVPVGVLPAEGVELETLPPLEDEDELLLLDEEEPPSPLELLELLLELLELLPPELDLELLLDEEDPPPPLVLEEGVEDEEDDEEPRLPPLLVLELLSLLPPSDEFFDSELPLLPPETVSLLAAGRQPVPIASSPAKNRPAKPVPTVRRSRAKVMCFVMMSSLVPPCEQPKSRTLRTDSKPKTLSTIEAGI